MEAAATVHTRDLSRLIGFGHESVRAELQSIERQGVRASGRLGDDRKRAYKEVNQGGYSGLRLVGKPMEFSTYGSIHG